MSRPRTSRARWDARRQALILPLPERLVVRAAAQFGRSGVLGIEVLGSWLRQFVQAAAATPRGRPRGDLRTASGRLRTLVEREMSDQIKIQTSLKGSRIKKL